MNNRREFLKKALFASGAAALSGTIAAPSIVRSQNERLEESTSFIHPKSRSHGAWARVYGSVSGSKDFPIRPVNAVASDGAMVWFVWPSDKGISRGYIKRSGGIPKEFEEIPELNTFLIRQGKPEPPYYLRWHSGDYYLYTPPGALVERAKTLMNESENWNNHAQALSDLRFATMINLAYSGKAEAIMESLSQLSNRARYMNDLRKCYPDFLNLLTSSR